MLITELRLRAQLQCVKLERVRGTGKPIEIAEEFRMLTLQVIGEAILSLSPEESDRVFPHLYLPIMEEGNRCSLEPWRAYLPPALTQRARVRRLNKYIIGASSRSRCAPLSLISRAVLCFTRCRSAAGTLEAAAGGAEVGALAVRVGVQFPPRMLTRVVQARPDIVDRIMDDIDLADWGEAAQRQLCYEIKARRFRGASSDSAPLTPASCGRRPLCWQATRRRRPC